MKVYVEFGAITGWKNLVVYDGSHIAVGSASLMYCTDCQQGRVNRRTFEFDTENLKFRIWEVQEMFFCFSYEVHPIYKYVRMRSKNKNV